MTVRTDESEIRELIVAMVMIKMMHLQYLNLVIPTSLTNSASFRNQAQLEASLTLHLIFLRPHVPLARPAFVCASPTTGLRVSTSQYWNSTHLAGNFLSIC